MNREDLIFLAVLAWFFVLCGLVIAMGMAVVRVLVWFGGILFGGLG